MPSAGRFVGAIFFGFIAWYVSELFKPLMPEGTAFGRFSEYNALVGVVMGWIMLGLRSHGSRNSSISAGLTTSVAVAFWTLLIHSVIDMLKLSLRNRYDGPLEAIVGVFQQMIKFAVMMATPEIILMLVVGGILTGMISGWAERRWR